MIYFSKLEKHILFKKLKAYNETLIEIPFLSWDTLKIAVIS